MGRHPIPFHRDAVTAWELIQARGGVKSLPQVIRRRDVRELFPALYRFDAMRRAGQVPGTQMVPGGVWRVDRDVFVEWLKSYLPSDLEQADVECDTEPDTPEHELEKAASAY